MPLSAKGAPQKLINVQVIQVSEQISMWQFKSKDVTTNSVEYNCPECASNTDYA